MDTITPEVIKDLKVTYSKASLYQLELPDGRGFVVRGSSWDEFSRLAKSAKGNEQRLALDIVRTFVVAPAIDATELEYNKSGEWEPGLIAALSEKIQEVLGYSKEITVKKL
ncbi:MAG: hypothetical protein WC326_16385 [Candidatus Delongbacteria bacterium]